MNTGQILVVDDDAAIRLVISEALRREGHDVRVAASVAEQVRILEDFEPDVLVTDVILPDGNGLDMVPMILEKRPDLPIIVLSAQNTLATAVKATERGAFEYLPKPFDLDELCRAVNDGLKRRGKSVGIAAGQGEDGLPLIGRSPPMQDVYRTIARVVPNDLSVLILGESGTGKELVAKAIHDLGPRKARPFVAINMAAIPRELIEAELFGHERGAFTGAQARVSGKFEQANGGTLFLDEIGDMPMEAQTRLLRVLQSGEFTTVGGNRPIKANVRIVAATHKNLPDLIAEGVFREDLYYRLNVVPVALPALRQRGADIGMLARHFLETAARQGLPFKTLDPEAASALQSYDWPGNVRELENLMRRLAVLERDDVIRVDQLLSYLGSTNGQAEQGAELTHTSLKTSLETSVEAYLKDYFETYSPNLPPEGIYDRILDQIERPLLRATLTAVGGNQVRAARLLGINRNTLRKKLSELDVDTGASPSRIV